MVMKQRIVFLALAGVVGFCSPAAAQTTAAQTALEELRDAAGVDRQLNAEDTRQDLHLILQKYPRSVGEILRRDPSLLAKADYMAAYPELAAFVAKHPEVPRNVEFYFEGYGSWGRQLDPSFEALSVLLAGLAVAFVLILFSGVLIWLVRALIQHRRWLKASQVQADVHTKLMERMHTNDELLAYIQSPAGRRFLEAAPIMPQADGPSFSAPVGSIVWSLMAGVVLTVVGIGFRYAGASITDNAREAFQVVGIIILSLGIGFIFASLMAYVLSARLGLFPPRAVESQPQSHA
jgi:hypothetical protein